MRANSMVVSRIAATFLSSSIDVERSTEIAVIEKEHILNAHTEEKSGKFIIASGKFTLLPCDHDNKFIWVGVNCFTEKLSILGTKSSIILNSLVPMFKQFRAPCSLFNICQKREFAFVPSVIKDQITGIDHKRHSICHFFFLCGHQKIYRQYELLV